MQGTPLSKIAPDAEFISAGDDVVVLDGAGGIALHGILVDAHPDAEDDCIVNPYGENGRATTGEWVHGIAWDRIAHPDSPQAEAAAMFGDN